jgi:hypothetical protein
MEQTIKFTLFSALTPIHFMVEILGIRKTPKSSLIRFEVLGVVTSKSTILWDEMRRRPAEVQQRFRVTHCLRLQCQIVNQASI